MAYDIKEWKRRIAERTDMSSSLVHLTREANGKSVEDVLYEILSSGEIVGSTTDSGFICGSNTAVCFQDIPLSSLCQNVFFEQKLIENNKQHKLRYRALGVMFDKSLAFSSGARPVIYDKTPEAKKYLPRDEWWRIVNLDLDRNKNIIDWTHEREWRCKGNFKFNLSDVTLLVIRHSTIKSLSERFRKEHDIDLISTIQGVIILEHILY